MSIFELTLCIAIVGIFSCAGLLIVRGGNLSHSSERRAPESSARRL